MESFRRVLAEHAVDRPIPDVLVNDVGALRGVDPARLRNSLRDKRFRTPRRHGKWLIVPITGGAVLLVHFGMTGSLVWADDADDRQRHDRIVFVFARGELRYRDMRKLQGIRLLADEAALDRVLADLGPDASTVSRRRLGELLGGSRRQVKTALTDQATLAGLGNLLADEVLWRARIRPSRSCADLSPADIGRLHARMGGVLRQAVKDGRVPPRPSWLTGRRDEPSGSCPRCGSTLSHGRVNGRGTVWCPRCQSE